MITKLHTLFTVLIAFYATGLSFSELNAGTSDHDRELVVIQEDKYGIGLTLSGGGARGLAHIGALHLIDSLGIKVDYVSGTSMGAIIGGMYAVGYSALEIEQMVSEIDWSALFSLDASMEFIHPARRRAAGKHVISTPLVGGQLLFETGAIEAQRLWAELSRAFFHVSHISDFSELPIPFVCVATNLETGEPVIMKKGDLIKSIRASMSIPAVFTAVEIDGATLIDGGVTKNFPVSVARDMGAGEILGVNVSRGLRPAQDLKTPLDVIYQMGFFSDARSFRENKELTHWLIDLNLAGISSADFSSAIAIIEKGKKGARENIAVFKEILERQQQFKREYFVRPAVARSNLVVREVKTVGRKNLSQGFVTQIVPVSRGDSVNGEKILKVLNAMYATDVFERVRIYASAIEGDEVDLVIEFKEKPFVRLSTNINYNEIQGVSIGGGIQADNYFLNNSHFRGLVLIGENPSFHGEYLKFLDYRREHWGSFTGEGSLIKFSYDGLYQLVNFRKTIFDFNFAYNALTDPDSYWSIGIGRRTQKLSQTSSAPVSIAGWSGGWYTFLSWKRYSLDRHAFPRNGENLELISSFHFGQKENLDVSFDNGTGDGLSDLDIFFGNYIEFRARWNYYIPLRHNLTQIIGLHAGYKLDYRQGFIAAYNLGGHQPVLYDQMEFVGLKEYTIISPAFFSIQGGWQRAISDRFFATLLLQTALFDFNLKQMGNMSGDNLLFGGSISLGFNSLVGPIEITFGYSPYTDRIIGYVNLGWTF